MIVALINRFRPLIILPRVHQSLPLIRWASSGKTDGERQLSETLRQRFPKARLIDVKDTSSGCGASYEVLVVTDEFTNMRTVNQHRLVSEALKQQLPNIHAIRIFTGTDEKQFIDS